MVGVAALWAVPAAAQDADTRVHAAVAALNVLTGGLTSGVAALLGGHDVIDAAVGGALGGASVPVGKRVAAQRFDGAGLLGRELAAVGTSVVMNAWEGRSWLETLWLPVGPVWLRTGGSPLAARVNAVDVVMTV